jgi:molecular chaperone GrpE
MKLPSPRVSAVARDFKGESGMSDKKKDDEEKEAEKSQDAGLEPEAVADDGCSLEGGADEGQVASPEKEGGGENDTEDELRQQLESMSDRYLRLMAEFDNFKKRIKRDYEQLIDSANEKLILDLIEIRENFERAMKTVEQSEEKSNLYDGIKLIYTKFDEILKRNGLDPFAETGQPFDPQIHDALMKVHSETIPEDHITNVFEKGYRLKSKVIRHAKVLVSNGKPQPQEPAEKE